MCSRWSNPPVGDRPIASRLQRLPPSRGPPGSGAGSGVGLRPGRTRRPGASSTPSATASGRARETSSTESSARFRLSPRSGRTAIGCTSRVREWYWELVALQAYSRPGAVQNLAPRTARRSKHSLPWPVIWVQELRNSSRNKEKAPEAACKPGSVPGRFRISVRIFGPGLRRAPVLRGFPPTHSDVARALAGSVPEAAAVRYPHPCSRRCGCPRPRAESRSVVRA